MPSMDIVEKRLLGANTLKVSKLGLGCMGMSECYGKTNDVASMHTIQKAFDLGVTHFDTADCYGQGHNEQLLGKAIKSFRDEVVIASKCGFVRDSVSGAFLGVNGTPDYIKRCCEISLKRLQVDYIDLFYLHRADINTPIEASMEALSSLVKEGKIRHIGLSEVNAHTIARAHKVHPLTSIQTEYSIWSRDPETEVLPLCKKLNIGFVAHSPLGKSFLAGKVKTIQSLGADDLRRVLPRFQDENIAENIAIIKILEEFSITKGCTVPQISLAWILAQGDNIVAIPGTKRVHYLEENIKATSITLSADELAELSHLIPVGIAKGAVLPEAFAKFSNN